MYNYYREVYMAEIHRKELMEKARISRLLRQSNPGKPNLTDRVLSRCGEFLVFVGERLIKRYQKKVEACYSLINCKEMLERGSAERIVTHTM